MARTTSANVRAVLGQHYDGSTSLASFIDTASSFVDKIASRDVGSLLTSIDLELIERWLAAHFYLHSDQIASSQSVGGASTTYQGQTGMFFQSTIYGQTAMLLDATGYLSELNRQASAGRHQASLVWAGTRYKDDMSARADDQ